MLKVSSPPFFRSFTRDSNSVVRERRPIAIILGKGGGSKRGRSEFGQTGRENETTLNGVALTWNQTANTGQLQNEGGGLDVKEATALRRHSIQKIFRSDRAQIFIK